jgi:hypothetical protein
MYLILMFLLFLAVLNQPATGWLLVLWLFGVQGGWLNMKTENIGV